MPDSRGTFYHRLECILDEEDELVCANEGTNLRASKKASHCNGVIGVDAGDKGVSKKAKFL